MQLVIQHPSTKVVWTHMLPECVSVRPQSLRVSVFDEPDDVLNTPAGRVLPSRTLAVSTVCHQAVSWVPQGNTAGVNMLEYLMENMLIHFLGES